MQATTHTIFLDDSLQWTLNCKLPTHLASRESAGFSREETRLGFRCLNFIGQVHWFLTEQQGFLCYSGSHQWRRVNWWIDVTAVSSWYEKQCQCFSGPVRHRDPELMRIFWYRKPDEDHKLVPQSCHHRQQHHHCEEKQHHQHQYRSISPYHNHHHCHQYHVINQWHTAVHHQRTITSLKVVIIQYSVCCWLFLVLLVISQTFCDFAIIRYHPV